LSPPNPRLGFKTAATPRPTALPERLAQSIKRIDARHEANRPRQVAERFTKMLALSDRAAPALKPSWAKDNRRAWLMRAAEHHVARAHALRIEKLKATADRMQVREKGHAHARDELER
jgi:hypothetical protein